MRIARAWLAVGLLAHAWLPGSAWARTIVFSGRSWEVKDSREERLGPGNNLWSDSPQNVWVDRNGFLHLKISYDPDSGKWYSSEVYTTEPTRYGAHRFFIIGRPDKLDKNVVFSPFLYKDDSHEIDIEFSTWGREPATAGGAGQYVVQPAAIPGNKKPFELRLTGEYTTHSMDWSGKGVRFRSLHGHYLEAPDANYLIGEWAYRGPSIPSEDQQLKVHINLWLHRGRPPSDGREVEMIVAGAELP